MRRPFQGALLLLLAIAVALPATASHPEAYATTDNVQYYFAYGALGSGQASLGPNYNGDASLLLPFEGCLFAQLRPELEHGRVRLIGLLDNHTIDLNIDGYRGGGARQGGIAANLTIDGSLDRGIAEFPAVPASAAAWGAARMTIDPSKGNPGNFTDPIGGGEVLDASLAVTDAGYRDDASHGIALAAGAGWFDPTQAQPAKLDPAAPEMHLRIRSPADASPTTDAFIIAPIGTLPDGSLAPDPEYLERFTFPNSRFGGQATAHIAASANAPPTLNSLTFTFFDSNGREVANKTLEPSIAGAASGDATFALDHFGAYSIRVSGKVALAQYHISITLAAPPTFDLHFWWDRVQFGDEARDGVNRCIRTLNEAAGAPASTKVGRAKPPGFPLEAVVLAVAGGSATVLVVTKLVSHTRATTAFNKTRRK